MESSWILDQGGNPDVVARVMSEEKRKKRIHEFLEIDEMYGYKPEPVEVDLADSFKEIQPESEIKPRIIKFRDYQLEMVGTMPAKETCGKQFGKHNSCNLADFNIAVEGGEQAHKIKLLKDSCHSALCVTCGPDVIEERAWELSRMIHGAREEYYRMGVSLDYVGYEKDRKTGKTSRLKCVAVEVVVSSPERTYHTYDYLEGFKHMYRTAKAFYEQIGFFGGPLFFHAIRGGEGNEENKVIEAYKRGEVELPFEPHYHGVGFMPLRHLITSSEFNRMTADLEHEPVPTGPNGGYVTGWTYKVIPKWKWGKHKKSYRKKIAYELDHASVAAYDIIVNRRGIESETHQHSQLYRKVGLCQQKRLRKEPVYQDDVCWCGNHVYARETVKMGDKLITHLLSEEPHQVLTDWLFRITDGTFNRMVRKYGLKVKVLAA